MYFQSVPNLTEHQADNSHHDSGHLHISYLRKQERGGSAQVSGSLRLKELLAEHLRFVIG